MYSGHACIAITQNELSCSWFVELRIGIHILLMLRGSSVRLYRLKAIFLNNL